MAAFLADDLTGNLFTLLWPLAVILVYKIVDSGHAGKRTSCRNQINCKNARMSQTKILKAGDWLEEVTVKTLSTAFCFIFVRHVQAQV